MITVGLTGGIGSGKSTVADVWEKQGSKIVKADDLAKALMQHDEKLKESIKNEFGNESYDKSGKLNRQYLAKEAFQKGKADKLNELVHPAVYRAIDQLIAEEKKKGTEVFVKEAALLLDHGRPQNLDFIVVVDAPKEDRVERIKRRDELSDDDIKGRISRQLSPEKMKEMADFVIENDGTITDLIQQAEETLIEIKSHR